MEWGPDYRRVISVRTPRQIVKIRDQPIPEFDQITKLRSYFRIHPRLVNRLVIVPGVNAEAGHENSALDPAQE